MKQALITWWHNNKANVQSAKKDKEMNNDSFAAFQGSRMKLPLKNHFLLQNLMLTI